MHESLNCIPIKKGPASGDQFQSYPLFSLEDIKSLLGLKGHRLIEIDLPPEFKLRVPNTDEFVDTAATDRQFHTCVKRAALLQRGNCIDLIGRTTRVLLSSTSLGSPHLWYAIPVHYVNLLASERHGKLYNSEVVRERFKYQKGFMSVVFIWKGQISVSFYCLHLWSFLVEVGLLEQLRR